MSIPASPPAPPFYVVALYPYAGGDTSAMSFQQGDIIEVLSMLASGWWDGVMHNGQVRGWFPSNYVQIISDEEAMQAHQAAEDAGSGLDGTGWWDDGTGGRESQTMATEGGGYTDDARRQSTNLQHRNLGSTAGFEDFLESGDDLTSFSEGGGIFAEIAAAAQADNQYHHEQLGSADDPRFRSNQQSDQAHRLPHFSSSADTYSSYASQDQSTSLIPLQAQNDDGLDALEDDFWVPKVTTTGQLFYLNTRTGETSRDMPVDGKGDGIHITQDEFPRDVNSSPAIDDGEWASRRTPDGDEYYANVRTGETAWRKPSIASTNSGSASAYSREMDRKGSTQSTRSARVLLRDDRPPIITTSSSSTSIYRPPDNRLSVRTQRTATSAETASIGRTDTLRRRGSSTSDESAMDGFENSARDSVTRSTQSESAEAEATATGGPVSASLKDQKAEQLRRKKVATAELLEPPPPPLIEDLDKLVSGAIEKLMVAVLPPEGPVAAPENPQVERDKLAGYSEAVVAAVRTMLHTAGVLEQIGSSSSSSSSSSASPSSSRHTSQRFSDLSLSSKSYASLRPTTRRVSTSLSKLTLSVRAVWGVLETSAEDQTLDGSTDEEPAVVMARWDTMRQRRQDLDAKQRNEVFAGTKDVQLAVNAFLVEFERVLGEAQEARGPNGGAPLPRSMLRAPKPLQGSLRTNAAALLLPGGGFGGNWRGNGFVTLPTPNSSPAIGFAPSSSPPVAGLGAPGAPESLKYRYPSTAITVEAAISLQKKADGLLREADALTSLVRALSSPALTASEFPLPPSAPESDPSHHQTASQSSIPSQSARSIGASTDVSPSRLAVSPAIVLERTGKLQRRIARFLNSIEDIDVASSIDFELAADSHSRPTSRGDFLPSSASASVATAAESPKEGDVESLLDPSTLDYRKSVQEARPLLAELEIAKQALYDVAPALLMALQELYMIPSTKAASEVTTLVSGPQPLKCSPLESFVSVGRSEAGPASALAAIAGLKEAIGQVCATFASLGAIAETQAGAPRHLRSHSLALRSSLFDAQTSPSVSSHADSQSHTRKAIDSGSTQPTTLSPSSSRQSLARTEDDSDANPRDSADSDYFFSKGPKSPARLVSKFTSSSWVKRSGSDASLSSKDASVRTRMSSNEEPSTPPASSPARKKNLAKMFGSDAPMNFTAPRPMPEWLKADYGPDEVSFNQEGQVRGGTLNALVIAATSHEGRVDSNYLSAFLMTYRTFCEASQLLTLLIQRYMIAPPEELTSVELEEWTRKKQNPIRARVANFLKSWVRDNMEHDAHNENLLRRIKDFAWAEMRKEAESQALQIIKAVDERLSGTAAPRSGNIAPGSAPSSIIPRTLRKLKFLDIDPLEIARQLTLKDGALFAKITPQECLGKAWPKEFGSEALNISAMIDMSNAVTRWVTETILSQDDLKKRANTLKHFINIADRCYALNNFSTLIHIIAGLNSTPIHRLRRTWETVNQKSMTILGTLNNVMRPDKNYKVYREALRGVAPPCVPFLGVYLTDWTFIGDGNPDQLREKQHQINFNKRQKASELILNIKLHQSTTYNLAAVPSLSQWLDGQLFPPRDKHASFDLASEDQRLYEISLMREPRERDDEKIARLLSESGFL